MRKVVTFLWFEDHAEEAADLYVSLFKDAKIVHTSYVTESVAKEAGIVSKEAEIKTGAVSTVDFELNGQNFTALNGGPMYKFTEATSILVACKDQAEIDKFWDTLSKGGKVLSCGWVTDKYGVTWQIVPESLDEMMRDPDAAKADRVSEAMLSMEGKLDLAELEKAYKGQ
jgi:predicted 3-demethylubiquinone-9 3-methyltransferase (glyoxalase superfamily)